MAVPLSRLGVLGPVPLALPLAEVEVEEGAAPCPAQVSSPGAEFGNSAAGASRPDRRVGVEGLKPRRRGGDEAEPGGAGCTQDGYKRVAGMFSRNHRSRVTVARGSALEMEFKRGRFRLSLFSDPPEVRTPHPHFPSPPRLPQPRPLLTRPRARRGAETPLAVSKPVVVVLKSQARTVGAVCLCRDTLRLASI